MPYKNKKGLANAEMTDFLSQKKKITSKYNFAEAGRKVFKYNPKQFNKNVGNWAEETYDPKMSDMKQLNSAYDEIYARADEERYIANKRLQCGLKPQSKPLYQIQREYKCKSTFEDHLDWSVEKQEKERSDRRLQ